VAHPPVQVLHPAPVRSYYDAPLLAAGGTSRAGGQDGGVIGMPTAEGISDGVAEAASSAAATLSVRSGPTPGQSETGTLAQALTPAATPRVRAGMLGNRSLILARGAKIDCAGDTAFDSTEAGLSTCTVTKNVYSDDGRVVLIERGSQINSQYRSNLSPGQKRTFILSARIETPHGVTVEIDSPVADALGRMGIDGYVDNHWGARIGTAMLLGLTQDAIGYLATRGGSSNGSVVYENTQQQGNDMATRMLDSTINIPPTLKQNQGAEFSIVVARDLDFGSVYALQPEGKP
jgi:type IV secretion system protein VirB10